MRRFESLAQLLLSLGIAVGCGGTTEPPVVPQENKEQEEKTHLEVLSTFDSNRGNALYVMARSVPSSKANTAIESYDEAERLLFNAQQSSDVILAEPLFPGVPLRVTLAGTLDNTTIFYFFFTNPGENWMLQVPGPRPRLLRFELGLDQVARWEANDGSH